MNVVVLMKQVPDTEGDRSLNVSDGTVDRESTDAVINYIDEFAIEEALQLKEAHGGDVIILTVGPRRSIDSIRKALAMGADRGVHVCDDALHGSDAIATATVIAQALRMLEWDAVIGGSEATDSRSAIVPALVAEILGAPQLTQARRVVRDGAAVEIERVTESGYAVVRGQMPVVISVVENINEPRFPSFKSILSAKRKPVQTMSLVDLGIDAGSVGAVGARTHVVSFAAAPPRDAGQRIVDDGGGGAAIAEFLASRNLI